MRAAVGLEDTGTEVDVRDTHEDRQEEEDVVQELGRQEHFGRNVHTPAAVGQDARLDPHDHAGNGHHHAEEEQCTISQTLSGLDVVLRGHMHLGRGKEVQRELHGPGHVVLVPLAEDVFLKEVHETLGALENRKEGHQDERHGQHAMQHAHGVREVAAHDAAPETRDENEDTGDRKKDAADGRNTVGHAGQKGVTLNIAGHLFLLIVLLP